MVKVAKSVSGAKGSQATDWKFVEINKEVCAGASGMYSRREENVTNIIHL
jgi:hypothetical protein